MNNPFRYRRVNNDEATRAIVYEGASINQLAVMFGLNNTETAKRLKSLAPSGIRSGYPIYKVGEAAEYLVTPRVDLEAYIRKAGHNHLPASLQKDIWTARNGQLKFELAQGSVYRVEKIHETWAEWFKRVRMKVLLLPDELEREGRLPKEFYPYLRMKLDSFLRALKEDVVEAMRQMPAQTAGIIEYEQDDDYADAEVASAVEEDDDEL